MRRLLCSMILILIGNDAFNLHPIGGQLPHLLRHPKTILQRVHVVLLVILHAARTTRLQGTSMVGKSHPNCTVMEDSITLQRQTFTPSPKTKMFVRLVLKDFRGLIILLYLFAEYRDDNPRTTLQCTHHFHLSCIYEWMERSETCPVCGRVSSFLMLVSFFHQKYISFRLLLPYR
ncbi:hypothetical protein B296_00027113 [Ensete ventricosum]|uniref:RING-type E3 ubiquitin transferase n=1 Tax=Ensete ventricosum TaxID=4639 RepID=A0A427AJ52_ENSVE|nr:hypothetical protein B296_00027113 [Ensete ventricosum]